jgi:hypothetical protein
MLINNKSAESLVWIIVWIFILSFVLLWIWNLIWNSRETISLFNEKMEIDILSKNSSSIINNLDLLTLSDWDIFYINKNTSSWSFDIHIWEHNREYKYIDKDWYKIDNPITYNGKIYTRIFQAKILNMNWEQKIAVKALVKKLN